MGEDVADGPLPLPMAKLTGCSGPVAYLNLELELAMGLGGRPPFNPTPPPAEELPLRDGRLL